MIASHDVGAIHIEHVSRQLGPRQFRTKSGRQRPCQGHGVAITGVLGGAYGGVSFHRTESYVKENSPSATPRKLAHPPPGTARPWGRPLAESTFLAGETGGMSERRPALHLSRFEEEDLDSKALEQVWIVRLLDRPLETSLPPGGCSFFFIETLYFVTCREGWISSVVHNSKEISSTCSTLMLGRTPGI